VTFEPNDAAQPDDTGIHPALLDPLPHPNLSREINNNIVQSEIEGGVHLHRVPRGTVLKVRTRNHEYTLVHQGRGEALISGHPEFCPVPVAVRIAGSTWGGSMLKRRFIGRGMHLEFWDPSTRRPILTSRIIAIHEAGTMRVAATLPEPGAPVDA